MDPIPNLTPKALIQQLDKYIIGQRAAKEQLAVAMRNCWRALHMPADLKHIPANILMIGPTGTGKTECARWLAEASNAVIVIFAATKLTERGYVGASAESMIHYLVEAAIAQVRQEKQQEVRARAEKIVEDKILDIVIPPVRKETGHTVANGSEEHIENRQTRQNFREMIRAGELDERPIDITVRDTSSMNSMGIIGGAMDDAAMANLENLLSKIMPRQTRKKKVTVREARQMLLEEQMENMMDMEVIRKEALIKAQTQGIVFIDEIDKIAGRGSTFSNTPDISREGVQRDLLPLVEGTTVMTKYGPVSTDHILFIGAGAFHLTRPSDLIPELQGRFPIRVKLDPLTADDFYRILKDTANSLLKQYSAMLAAEGVDMIFEAEAVREIARFAYQMNEELENIGARRLSTVLSHLLQSYLIQVPDDIGPGSVITITTQVVNEKLADLLHNKAASEYIL